MKTAKTTTATYGDPPQVGMKFKHAHTGKLCTVIHVFDYGTMVIQDPDNGQQWRVTGLGWGRLAGKVVELKTELRTKQFISITCA